MIVFKDSGLEFHFPDDNCYRIETDSLVTRGSRGSTANNMACECVSVIQRHHCFIEVKSSAPQGAMGKKEDLALNGCPLPKNWVAYDNYQVFLRSIAKKFSDSFYILKSLQEGRHGNKRANEVNLPCTLSPDSLRFILIINFPRESKKYVDRQSLVNLQDAIKGEMRPFLNIWNIKDTSVKVVLPEDAVSILHIPIITESFSMHH